MKRKWLKKSLLATALLLLALTIWQARWVGYLLHLASHQLYVWTHNEPIEKAQAREDDPEKKKRFELISKVKEFGKELYDLKKSQSYSQYVQLPRDTLAWNITAAPALKLKPKEFYFVIGSFSYLGFVERELLDHWKEQLASQGYDIYESDVSAYSTLGYLSDPLFSTYLEFSDKELVRLILHEMSHEKLYFKDDSSFSESLSSFIDGEAVKRWNQKQGKPPARTPRKSLALKEYHRFYEAVENLRIGLEKIYGSEAADEKKLTQKAALIKEFRQELKNLQKEFRHYKGPEWMLSLPEINNAVLIQIKRYSGHTNDAFRVLLKEECKDDILCWFERLEALKPCEPDERAEWLKGEVSWGEVIEKCGHKL